MPNPFKPTAGARPPLLIGRQQVLDEFGIALEDGPGAPGRLSLLTGARGVGKTVLLTEMGESARARGWVVVDETVTPGLLGRLVDAAAAAVASLDTTPHGGRRVSGLTVAGVGGMVFEAAPRQDRPGLQMALEQLLDALEAHGVGLLVTVDEVHRKGMPELRQLAAVHQHLVRRDRDVALALAGLPSSVEALLGDDVLTFLRRAERVTLADVPLPAVRQSLGRTFDGSGRTIRPEALDAATAATGGYPFMVQLVGYHVWRAAHDGVVDLAAAEAGVAAARVRLGSTVHEANLNALSAVDRTYLVAMAQDEGASRTVEVARRLDRDMRYQSVYRDRLIAAGIIRPAGHGLVEFAVPYLGEYLREHAARYEMQDRGGSRG